MPGKRSFPHLLIRASAGTGKTYQLSNRFIQLVAAGERADHILAATFARKAAGEILERILTRLADAALDDAKRSELAKNIGAGKLTPAACLGLLRNLIGQLHRLRIGTLDSFFSQLAASFSLELALPPGWSIVDELEEARLRREAIQTLLDAESTSSLVTMMNLLSKGDVQRSVAAEIRGVVENLHELHGETVDDAWDALPRYKRIADDELADALERLSQLEFPDKRFGKARDGNIEAAAAGDWDGFIGKGLAAKILAGAGEFYKKPITEEIAAAYRPLIDEAKAVLIGKTANQTLATRELLSKFDAAYRRLKQSGRGLRFDDVTRSLAAGFADGRLDDVSWRLDTQLEHLLLDEFQDTSCGQWQVVRPFAERVTDGANGSFFCVGDVKQAIYRWRGGVSEILEAVGEQLPGIEPRSLTKSYRSSQPVIDTVNRVFSDLAGNAVVGRFPSVAEEWGRRYETHTTAKTELSGYCRLMTADRAGPDEQQSEATLSFAAAEIADIARRNPGRSIGVLVRRNAAVARLIYELRQLHQLPASEEGGNPLTDSAAVCLLLSLLRIADHPGDTAARFHVATSPLAGVVDFHRHDDSAAAARLSLALRESLLNDGYGATIYGWARALSAECDARDVQRLLQLVEMAYGYEAGATVRVDDFIRVVETRRVETPTAANVRVMTLHQAKGLQFEIVVLPELDINLKGRPPSVVVGRDGPVGPVLRVCRYVNEGIRRLLPAEFQQMFEDQADQAVNESLCLLYVALTRAVHALYMIVAPAKENEKTMPATAAGVLRTALTDGAPPGPQQVLFELGDPAPFTAEPQETATMDGSLTPDEAPQPVEVRLRKPPAQRSRGLDRQSPSGLEGGARVSLSRRMRLESETAMSRGTLFHGWFEAIEWSDDPPPTDDELRTIAAPLVEADVDLKAEIAAFREMLKNEAIAAALSRSAYDDPAVLGLPADVCAELKSSASRLRVFREQEFAVRDGDAVLKGAIDRFVVLYDGEQPLAADVIDFKTDRVDDSAEGKVSAKVAHYRPQIEAYCRTVSRLTGLEPSRIVSRLLFVGAGLCERVS